MKVDVVTFGAGEWLVQRARLPRLSPVQLTLVVITLRPDAVSLARTRPLTIQHLESDPASTVSVVLVLLWGCKGSSRRRTTRKQKISGRFKKIISRETLIRLGHVYLICVYINNLLLNSCIQLLLFSYLPTFSLT